MVSRKRVLLIYPEDKGVFSKRMPLAILYLAESLINAGYEPVLLDMQVDTFAPEMLNGAICVGISTLSGPSIRFGLEVAKQIRAQNPEIPIVWGGIHPSILPKQTLMNPLVDYVICGEGEEAFPEFVRALDAKANFEGIPNLAYKKGKDSIAVNPVRILCQSAPLLPFARSLLPIPLIPIR